MSNYITDRKKQREYINKGFQVRIKRENPRNPDAEPTQNEREQLELMRRAYLNEGKTYLEIIDRSYNLKSKEDDEYIAYFPIILNKDCLICHGDPAKSQEFWGNDKGKDFLGLKMEGMKEGDVFGALIVKKKIFDEKIPLKTWERLD